MHLNLPLKECSSATQNVHKWRCGQGSTDHCSSDVSFEVINTNVTEHQRIGAGIAQWYRLQAG
jgi:hypothetical protein